MHRDGEGWRRNNAGKLRQLLSQGLLRHLGNDDAVNGQVNMEGNELRTVYAPRKLSVPPIRVCT